MGEGVRKCVGPGAKRPKRKARRAARAISNKEQGDQRSELTLRRHLPSIQVFVPLEDIYFSPEQFAADPTPIPFFFS